MIFKSLQCLKRRMSRLPELANDLRKQIIKYQQHERLYKRTVDGVDFCCELSNSLNQNVELYMTLLRRLETCSSTHFSFLDQIIYRILLSFCWSFVEDALRFVVICKKCIIKSKQNWTRILADEIDVL